ncbi:golgi membrane protein yip1 [Holotrichia oblita]|uniref:Golgi membrane protein yip1 n=3 Tax=Holotrichia oblita TaxID=644536 RepID=A0ACB9SZ71_HOLOL|nr:golgi membrane protein yip1 [Holotrichia oblita]KAI4459883.1 golgi membrane protein yip1 [Holotrichia oblita]KAI4459886.1 golgi membrane protein yip1 [Holotrichia oblita]
MSGYAGNEAYLNMQESINMQANYYNSDVEYSNLQTQQLDFQSFNDPNQGDAYYMSAPSQSNQYMNYATPQYPDILTPDFSKVNQEPDDYDEPPLLEELEIYPDRIVEKTLAVLNPFRSHGLADDADFLAKDTDLAGPLSFCLLLAITLFVSGNRAPFGYIYGLSVFSCIFIYCLLTLMTSNDVFTLARVASILGYCLLPIVILSIVGIFISLHGGLGIVAAILAVLWSCISASRLFVAMSGDNEQRPLIAYPCALVCGVFALLVVF